MEEKKVVRVTDGPVVKSRSRKKITIINADGTQEQVEAPAKTAKKTTTKKSTTKKTTTKKTTKAVTETTVRVPVKAAAKAPAKRSRKKVLDTPQEAKLNVKTEQLREYFLAHKMEMFTAEHLGDANETTILRTKMEVGGAQLPMAILIDKSAYMLIQVEIMPEVAKGVRKFKKFARSLVALNNVVRLFKFTISDKGDLMLNVVLTSPDGTFEPALFHAILMEIMRYLDRDYRDLVKAIEQVMA